ncbi:hypothetical protein PybrP1_002816 [[Pythium] brassicae (nom. inval.)]|nr:hypothetical protein PybrP1_002816 [[Pythium] brassicae (nom. inval.)]
MADNAERAVRYLHEATQGEDGEDGARSFSCRWFLDRSFFCVTPGNQMTHFYRYGTVDECKGTWKNMYHCLRASMMDTEKRAEYLKGTTLDPSKPPHAAEPLELKETPGW